ncbi:hypothetical protein [Mycolicibacter virginiensis]|uniref:hypothetical protein n=1 Tax=Mycolicibacter virginiensis TaxID=1795032 RepID=UPI001F0336CB|nr:hypothetical protein [Mycolicibacter virginiensis]ULP45882.1 hypothetical protein MJO54_13485 [Mycolicibacter virginiensis]
MTPRIIHARDRKSSAASRQFVREAAAELVRAEQARLEALRWIAQRESDPLKVLDALRAYRSGEDVVDAALAKVYASLRLGGVSAHALGAVMRTRTQTIAARISAFSESRRIATAGRSDIKKSSDGGYFIAPSAPRSTVIEEL